MKFLVTNDDGILAHGIECLIEAAEPLGDVYVVAPDREQSATSHSLTLHHPLRPVRRGERRWQVDGTPTDCVMLAVEALLPERLGGGHETLEAVRENTVVVGGEKPHRAIRRGRCLRAPR